VLGLFLFLLAAVGGWDASAQDSFSEMNRKIKRLEEQLAAQQALLEELKAELKERESQNAQAAQQVANRNRNKNTHVFLINSLLNNAMFCLNKPQSTQSNHQFERIEFFSELYVVSYHYLFFHQTLKQPNTIRSIR